jgi:uncharacterized small protein (DUF1192 family)
MTQASIDRHKARIARLDEEIKRLELARTVATVLMFTAAALLGLALIII